MLFMLEGFTEKAMERAVKGKAFSISVLLFLCVNPCYAEWIDKTGKVIQAPNSNPPEPSKSSDGMSVFGVYPPPGRKSQGTQYGFKSEQGTILIPAKFLAAGRFRNGLAPVFM